MLNISEFTDELITLCRKDLSDCPDNDIEIEKAVVRKPQFGHLTGLRFRRPDGVCAPTVYAEDMYQLFTDGQPIDSLAKETVAMIRKHIDNPPPFAAENFDPLEYPDHLRVRLISKSRNKDIIDSVPYINAGGDLVMIADMVCGDYRALITNDILNSSELSQDDLFDRALHNSSVGSAVLTELQDVLTVPEEQRINLLRDPSPALKHEGPGLYVLSNRRILWGAAALFYPGVMQRIHDIVGGSFYVLPSSVHELIIVPVSNGDDPGRLVDMIRSANRTVVSVNEVLSDDLYICESGKLERVSYGGYLPESGALPS